MGLPRVLHAIRGIIAIRAGPQIEVFLGVGVFVPLTKPNAGAPGLKLSHANYNRTRSICTPVSAITDSPSLSHHRNTIEFA
jgi:hypothetical protein